MRILLKYPTRSRPELFKSTLTKYIETASQPLRVVVTIDRPDLTMNNAKMLDWMAERGVEYHVGDSTTKIQAINADIPPAGWDILALASDDHLPVKEGWDDVIRSVMPEDLDALVWTKDIRQSKICLMPFIGKTYYDRFGYIYHPSYVSLWCDNEQTDVARLLGKLVYHDEELFRNESADWGGSVPMDRLYRKNNGYYRLDGRNYERRKAKGFPK